MSTVAAPIVPVLKRRLKSLSYLGIATGVAVLLAAIALWQRASTGEPDFKPERMFPSLAASLKEVATIQIETKKAAFNVARTASGDWKLPDKGNYPADFSAVRKTILGLSDLELVDRRTARADWQDKLGLGLPKTGGSGTLVTLKDSKGEVLASAILGSGVEGASAGGKQALYVRRPTQDQTFVARGNISVPADETQWLDKAFVDLARDRIQTVSVKPVKGRPFTVTRAHAQDTSFHIVETIPVGRILRTEGEPNGIGNALVGLSFDDVQAQTKFDFTNASHATFVSFDGLTVNLGIIEKDNDMWVTVDAAANPQPAAPPAPGSAPDTALKPDVAKEAKEINGVVNGWAYKIARYKGVLLSSPLDDLLKPVGVPPAGDNK